MPHYHLRNVQVVNEGKITAADVLFKNGRIERIDPSFSVAFKAEEVNGEGKYLIPGIIDDQVHFREPGLTHKATIYTEARAAVAGGTTSFMEMPNTNPPALSRELLEQKYQIATQHSLANFSFFMGVGNDNIDELKALLQQQRSQPQRDVCGLKIFMGSSTGNMLVDNTQVLEQIFAESDMLIATHCEDEATVKGNLQEYKDQWGDALTASFHPLIRSVDACFKSSSFAIALAKKHNTRLHILHISTAKETELFSNAIPLSQKRITAEACVHHLWFDARDYERLGNKIKCNPAIKEEGNKEEILKALLDDRIDIIATDHAPHTRDEKAQHYLQAPAGLPLVQHSLNVMLLLYRQGKISLEKIIEKMCHAPAVCFGVHERGYLREGYFADAALVDIDASRMVTADTVYYKCGWSPFEGQSLPGVVESTFVNGHRVFHKGSFDESVMGKRLMFM
ncbi:MAG: dihydroorotase [Chitinophagales bacterium]